MAHAVGRQDHSVQASQCRICRQGLFLKHIQRGTGQALLREQVGQGRLVHRGASGQADEKSRGLKQLQMPSGHHGWRTCDGPGQHADHVAVAHQGVQAGELDMVWQLSRLFASAVNHNANAPRAKQLGHQGADASPAHQAHGFAPQRLGFQGVGPWQVGAHGMARSVQVVDQVEHEHDGGFCHAAVVVRGGRIGHQDAALGGCVHIKAIGARDARHHRVQLRRRIKDLSRHGHVAKTHGHLHLRHQAGIAEQRLHMGQVMVRNRLRR